jgi:hypothetical protein
MPPPAGPGGSGSLAAAASLSDRPDASAMQVSLSPRYIIIFSSSNEVRMRWMNGRVIPIFARPELGLNLCR